MPNLNEKFIMLGASRGLGWCTYQLLQTMKPQAEYLISSRKVLLKAGEVAQNTKLIQQDFSKPGINQEFAAQLKDFVATHLIYFAGGGPYGFFQDKKWSDHQWSLQTSFLYPAELLHFIMAQPESWPNLKKIVLIGSSVAEDKADPRASSYSAAKHALRGLVGTIQEEIKAQPEKKLPQVLLFSPPYMQTDLLPAHSQPRLNDRAENPEVVARRLIEYIENT
jgi:short-subunit dehydrogenase